jgi:hypothetical protein
METFVSNKQVSILLVTLVLYLSAGCGSSDDETTPLPAAASSATSPAAPSAAPAPAPAPAERSVVGTWSVDAPAIERMRAGLPEEQAMGLQMMTGMQPTWAFAQDGGYVTTEVSLSGTPRRFTGRYEITSRAGDAVTVRTTREDGRAETMTFTLQDGRKALMRLEGAPFDIPLTAS